MIWRCVTCSIEGPAESFPTRHVPAVTSFVEGRTLASTRLACPLCGGALKPKTRAEIEADEDRRFVAAIEHEMQQNSGRVAGTAAESNAEKPDAGGGARVMRRSQNAVSDEARQSGETGDVHALTRANSSTDRAAAASIAAAVSLPTHPEMRA